LTKNLTEKKIKKNKKKFFFRKGYKSSTPE